MADKIEPMDEGDTDQESPAREPSQLATEISMLKESLNKAISKRERVPQPTFWFLLHRRIADMKKRRAMQRTVTNILDP
ncbi:MAG: hypothetical protein K1X79_10695 [Oligoflexia bacterium]|nr:hypothetical protein [Oligoflexia bacterium]